MAQETNLIKSAVDVSEVIQDYARKAGWRPEEYKIQMIINTNFFWMMIFLFTKFPLNEDEKQNIYDDLFDRIRKKYKENDHVPVGFNSFGIDIEDKEGIMYNTLPYFEDAVYVPSELLNPPPAGAAR